MFQDIAKGLNTNEATQTQDYEKYEQPWPKIGLLGCHWVKGVRQ